MRWLMLLPKELNLWTRIDYWDGVCKMADRSRLPEALLQWMYWYITMVKAGIPLGDAINMVSETPAMHHGGR